MRRQAGPVTKISVFATEISITELEFNFFPIMNTPARITGLSVTKYFQLRMACKVADKSDRGSTGILAAFWTFFISVTGIKFLPTRPAQLPGSYEEPLSYYNNKEI